MTGKKDAGSDRRSDQGRTRGAPEAVKTPRVFDYLSGMPHFSFVSEEERKAVSEKAAYESYPEGHVYAVQGQTEIQDIFVVVKGSLSLYDGGGDDKRLIGHIKPGEVFGGISILLNGGVSLRTVVVDRDCSGIAIPRGIFQDLCTRSKVFYEYFLENFSSHIFDPALTNIIETGQTRHFLARVDPFSFLPAEEIDPIVSQLSMVHYPKGAVLFVQGRSRVGYLYILQKGSAERYYEEGRKKTMSGMLGEGDAYGGISMLLNDGISVRTLQVTEDSYFYLLPKQQFLDICARNEAFSEYFTDIFGKRMLERSYARIVANTAHPKEEGSLFFNRLVTDIYAQNPAFCGMDASIRDTACIMRSRHIGSVFIQDEKGRCVGVVTERDLTEKVIAEGIDPRRPVSEVMSSPVRAIPGQALVFEALMVMMQENIRHLAVTGADDAVIGVLSSRDLLAAQGHSPLLLLREIADAGDMDAIIQRRGKVPEMVRGLIASGVQAKNVTRFITAVSDAILDKLVGYALDTLGAPPARFAFMIMGSEGRREQTLKTDQDNAIVFEDVPASRQAEVTDYFLKFGETVCNLLDQAGYAFCTGGVMAKNPKWCQPLSAWKDDFSSWIHAAEPEDLLQASIFFDFRAGHGDKPLVDDLRTHLFDALQGWSGFFRHLTINTLHFRPPIGFFRNFVVESKGQHRDALDIKGAMTSIVDFARIYALQGRIEETNTLGRLEQLRIRKKLPHHEFEELEKAYSFLLQIRFVRQVTMILDEKASPDNYVNPKKLTQIEQKMLKEIFRRIEKFQTKLEFEFIGMV